MARYFFFYVALVTLAAQAQENPAETAKPPQTTLGVSTEDTAHNDNSDRNQSLPIESTMENTIETVVTAQTADKASATEAEEDNAKSTQNQLSTPQAEGTTNSSKTRSSTPDISGTRREVTEATTQFVQTTSEHSPATSVTEKLSVTSTTTATRATTSLPKQTTVPQNTSNPPKDVSASQTRTTVDGGLATAQDTPSRLAETPIASSTTPPSNSPANASTADASTVNPAEGQSTSHGVDLYHPIIPDRK